MSLPDVFSRLPTIAIVALVLVAVAQLSLQIFGLVDLARRDEVPGGRKWVWALIIVLGNIIGALVYLAVGRSLGARASDGESRSGGESAARRAVDSLYGPDDRA